MPHAPGWGCPACSDCPLCNDVEGECCIDCTYESSTEIEKCSECGATKVDGGTITYRTWDEVCNCEGHVCG